MNRTALCLVLFVVSCIEAPDITDSVEASVEAPPDRLADREGSFDRFERSWDVGDDPLPQHFDPLNSRVVLRVTPADIWGRALEDAVVVFGPVGDPQYVLNDRPAEVGLTRPGTYAVWLSAPDHQDVEVMFHFDGSAGLDSLELRTGVETEHDGVALARGQRLGSRATFDLFIGLRHKWFAASGPAPTDGNDVDVLISGAEAWPAVHRALLGATETINISTWFWESDTELVRDQVFQSEQTRWPSTIMGTLERVEAVVRVLVWQDNLVESATVDSDLIEKGHRANDDFEFMGMSNPTQGVFWWEVTPFDFSERVQEQQPHSAPMVFDERRPVVSVVEPREVDLTDYPLGLSADFKIASWHQKFLVIDGDEAFVGGMNVRGNDWDGPEHLVFDPRRMAFDSTLQERAAVAHGEAEADNAPRRDYMVRLVGPAVESVEEVFHSRWLHQLDQGAQYSQNASRFSVRRDLPEQHDGVQVQVTTTMPRPWWSHSTLESHLNAIANADSYILVEDQYWRTPTLVDAIIERMERDDDLVLIVVTKPVDEWLDPGCEWTYRTDERLRATFPDRYFVFTLRSFDTIQVFGFDETDSIFADVDIHSKLMIVDDVFLSVGSTNKNDRGFIYEGEMNVGIFDPPTVSRVRERIVDHYLGYRLRSDDPAQFLDALRDQARRNESVRDRWEDEGFDLDLDGARLPSRFTPRGLVYPLEFGSPDRCLIEGIGEDLT